MNDIESQLQFEAQIIIKTRRKTSMYAQGIFSSVFLKV